MRRPQKVLEANHPAVREICGGISRCPTSDIEVQQTTPLSTVLKQIIGQKPQLPSEPSASPASAEPYLAQDSPYDQPRRTATAPVRTSSAMSTNKNILSSDVEIKGSLKFSNDLIIDGKIEGEVTSDGSLTVGENAFVQGEIRTKSVVLFGRVQGNITVSERCELKSSAVLEGDVVAGTLAIEEGATFMGKSSVGKSAVAAANKAKIPVV